MLEFTIKTLDSNNHSISVEDDTTVFGLKQKLLEQLGIQIDQQRLIFFGRVLHDNKKLSDYGVQGKVVHLVERPPPRLGQQTSNDGDAATSSRRVLGMPTLSVTNDPDPRPPSPTAARIDFLQRSIEDIRGLLDLLGSPDTWLPSTGDRPDGAGNNEPPPQRAQNQPPDPPNPASNDSTNQPNSDQNEGPRAGPSQPGPSSGTGLMGDADLTQVAPCTCHIIGPPNVPRATARSNTRSGGRSRSAPTESAPTGSNSGSSGDRNGQSADNSTNHSRTQLYAQLLADFMQLEEQFSRYRLLYIDWIRSTPNHVALSNINVNDESLRRKQQFSNLISELHHSFGHAHHVISDINYHVTPVVNRLTSEPIMTNPIIQGFPGGRNAARQGGRAQPSIVMLPQHVIPIPRQGPQRLNLHMPPTRRLQPITTSQIFVQMPTNQQNRRDMPQQLPVDYARVELQIEEPHGMALGSLPEEIRQVDMHRQNQHAPQPTPQEMPMRVQQQIPRDMPPRPQPQNQRPVHQETSQRDIPQQMPPQMPPQQQHRHQPTAPINIQQGNQGAQAPILLGIPPQALNINVQSNPVTFQLEIETRSLEAALLNTVVNHVSQFVANQAAGNPPNDTPATDNQGTPQSTDNQQTGESNSPILGLNLGTVHLGTFNLGNIGQGAGMDVDTQSAPQGAANMETDSQGTNQSASNNPNGNQENLNQNGLTSRQQALLDFENLLRGISQNQGLNDMEVVMSFDVPANDGGQAFAANNPHPNPGNIPTAQNTRPAAQEPPIRENPPPQPQPQPQPQVQPQPQPQAQPQPQPPPGNGSDHLYGRIRTRMRAAAPATIQNVYDRFLVCNSVYARRQVLRRRRLADLARHSPEIRPVQDRQANVPNDGPPPMNQEEVREALHELIHIDDTNTFAEAMIANILVSIHEATVAEDDVVLTTEQFECLRLGILSGVRHQSFVCNIRRGSFAMPSLATLLVHVYKGFAERLRALAPMIRPHVDESSSVRRLCLTHMARLFGLMQNVPTPTFVENYRRLYAEFFYDLVGMLTHIAVDGVAGFRLMYNELIEEFVSAMTCERARANVRTVASALLERAIAGRVPPPSGPHRFVMRTDGLRRCICDEEDEPVEDVAPEEAPANEVVDPDEASQASSEGDDENAESADRPLEAAERLLNDALEETRRNRRDRAGASSDGRRARTAADAARMREQEQQSARIFRDVEDQLVRITGESSNRPSTVDLTTDSPGELNLEEPTSSTENRRATRRPVNATPSNGSTAYHGLFEPRDHEYGRTASNRVNVPVGQRPRRSIPTATVTSGSLNTTPPRLPSPILIPDSPPPRQATASPANKRMKQDSGNADGDQAAGGPSSGAIRKTQSETDNTTESKRKFPSTRGNDRGPDSASSEDSSESQRRPRVEQHWERKWVSVIDGDQQTPVEPQPPYSDAYLAGMTARRRRRARQARPPLLAGAFIHDCMSAASERALEGGEVERAVFHAFLDTLRGMTAARADASEDYRPAVHTAVTKFLDRSSSQEETTSTPSQDQIND